MLRHFALRLKRIFEYRHGAVIFWRLVVLVQDHHVAKLSGSRTPLNHLLIHLFSQEWWFFFPQGYLLLGLLIFLGEVSQ